VRDAAFDAVVGGLVLNFVPDQPRAAAEMRRAARPGGKDSGPTADVPPRSRTRDTATSASGTAKYGVQATAICHIEATAAIPATGVPSTSAIRNRSPSCADRHSQPSTAE